MTIKLVLLKSGEDIIADITEMVFGEEENRRVMGYYLNKPCIVRMKDPNFFKSQEELRLELEDELEDESEGRRKENKTGYEVSLYPWMPLSADETVPIPADWLVTMVEPNAKLKDMYVEDIVNHGKDNQSDSTTEQSNTDKSD